MSDKRVVLGKLANNNYGLQISKAGVDVIDDTINSQDYLFNSEVYRAGTIRSNSEYSNMTTLGVELPTTSDSSGNAYIPAYIVSEKGAFNPQGKFVEQYGSGGSSGGTRTVTLVNCLNTAAGGGMFQFSLSSTTTTKNRVTPFFVDVDSLTDPRPGTGSGTYPYLAARSRSSSDGAVKIQILGIPCQFGKMTNSTTLFGNSLLTGSTPTGGGGSTGGGGVLSAPTVTGTSRTARNNTNDTISVSTSNGTNNSGTITYAQSSSNSSSGLTFQSSSSFSNHTRGTTKYYFAKQTNLVSANTGTNHVHASAAVDITPSGFNNLVATAASGSAGTATYTIAGLGTGDTASVASLNNVASFSPSSGVNGTTITFSLNATGNAGNTTSANITVGTTTRTFVVTTSDSITFNPSDFTNTGTGTSGVNPGATVTSNAITVGGIPGAAVSVTTSGCTVSIAGGSFVSSGTVSNNQTVTIRSTASSTFGAALNPSITVGSTTINQTVTTRTASVGVIPDSMTATQSTNTNANTQTVTCTASGGSGTTQFSNDNSNWGTGNTFTQTRNTTVTYYARKTDEGGTSNAISRTEFVPPLFVIGTYSNTSNVSASGGTINNASSGGNKYVFNLGAQYGTVSLSASATTNPGPMISNVSISSLNASVGATVIANSGSARTGTITVSATTSQGGSPSSQTFNVPQAAAASNLWEVGITQGGGNSGSGYSRVVAFFGNTTDATCDLFTGTPAWRFSDTPSASSNTIFSVSGLVANSGWTSVKIYSGTSASGTLLATRLRSQSSYSTSFLGFTSWDLGGDNTSTSGSLYLVFA